MAAAQPVLDRLPAVTGTALVRDPRVRAALASAQGPLHGRRRGPPSRYDRAARGHRGTDGATDPYLRGPHRTLRPARLPDAVIFGHARDGNLHFMLTQDFDSAPEIERYARFTDAMVDLVLDAGGTLKAEHGTGRAMAPFVRRQYGDELYDVMRELKQLCDPHGVLNPGVLLEDDRPHTCRASRASPRSTPPSTHASNAATASPSAPRRRHHDAPSAHRPPARVALATAAGDDERRRALEADYTYAAVDSCAADSLCVTACPVTIDTGAVMKSCAPNGTVPPHNVPGTRRPGTGVPRSRVCGWRSTPHTCCPPRPCAPPPVRSAGSERGTGAHVGPTTSRAAVPRARSRQPVEPQAVFFAACIGSVFAPRAPPVVRPPRSCVCVNGPACRSPCLPSWRAVLRYALAVQGLHRRAPHHGEPHAGGAVDGQRPRSAARGLRCLLLYARPGTVAGHPPGVRPRPVRLPALRRQRRLHRGAPAARPARAPPPAQPRPHPTLFHRAPGHRRRPAHRGRGRERGRHRARQLGLLRLRRGPRSAASGITASATAAQAAEINAGTYDAYASCNRTCEMGMTVPPAVPTGTCWNCWTRPPPEAVLRALRNRPVGVSAGLRR